MTSPPALQDDQYYHIYHRGKNRENLFIEERNYRYFLRLYEKYIPPLADTFAYCLLRNHFHFLVRIKGNDCQSGEDWRSYKHVQRTCSVHRTRVLNTRCICVWQPDEG